MTGIPTEERRASAREPFAPPGAYGQFIGGEEVAVDESFAAVDPSTGREWTRLGQAGDEHVDAAVRAAGAALGSWRRSSPAERQQLLWRLADHVEQAGDWPTLLATENGRPIREALTGDVPIAAEVFRFYAGVLRGLGGENLDTGDPAMRVWTVREPVGVVAGLIPWNSPLISTALKLAPALAMGNTVVLKPSELASASVVEFARRTVHLIPPGVLNVLTGDGPKAGAALVGHPGVDKISFTGGVATARAILRAAAEEITPAILELGGKSAFVICGDADLDAAVADAVTGIAFQNGEVCFAASRLLVHESIRDEFVDRFVEMLRGVRIGDALEPATQVGPLVCAAHRERVLDHVARAVAQGATLLSGGHRLQLDAELAGGFFVEPAVVEDPGGVTSVSREEVFGPVVTVQTWTDEAEAIERANATSYGLAAGVWTSDIARAHRFADELEAGTVWVNTWFQVPAGQPLGGVKASGHGREMCAETLLEYSVPKAVSMRLGTERPPLWS
jgi:aldehyde dehydrogenase